MANVFIQSESGININDAVRLSVNEFRILEPSYEDLPAGFTVHLYRPGMLNQITGNGTITLSKEWINGDRYISRVDEFVRLRAIIDAENAENDENLRLEIKKRQPWLINRKADYPHIEELIVALWETIVEGRTDSCKAIQDRREQIKTKYPKTIHRNVS